MLELAASGSDVGRGVGGSEVLSLQHFVGKEDMRRRAGVSVVLVLGVMVAGIALAEERPRGDRRGGGGRDWAKKQFSRMDADGDGKLTREELGERARMIDRADKDEDGAVSLDEFRQFMAERRREAGAGRGGEERRGRGGDERRGRGGDERRGRATDERRGRGAREKRDARRPRGGDRGPSPLLAALDADKDGRLSKDELAQAVKLMDKFDANQDGFLDGVELRQAMGGRGGRERGAEGRGRGRGGPGQMLLERTKRMDRDGDGTVTRKEFDQTQEGDFKRLDRNGDGVITEDEVRALAGGGAGRRGEGRGRGAEGGPPARGRGGPPEARHLLMMLKRKDADGDGQLTREEFMKDDRLFKHLDRDGDGAITEAEVKKGAEEIQRRLGERGGRERRGGPGEGRPGAGRGGLTHWFDMMDKNGDGKISREEFVGPEERFNKRDKDGDGFITREEAGVDRDAPAGDRRGRGERGDRRGRRREPPPPSDEPPVDF